MQGQVGEAVVSGTLGPETAEPFSRVRWATFDCYGTLIDWNAGIAGELERLFGSGAAPRLL
ncbi:MAG: hypothetical protein M3322_03345, partial [Actinomycetota bacterium]|nr:hypothetical protein [Actinomycetota bacterium]